MIAAPAMQPTRPILAALLDLFKLGGYGAAQYEVNDAGELVHARTVITVKMDKGETIEAFVARLRREYDWQRGDTLELLSNNGRLDTARITRMPRG